MASPAQTKALQNYRKRMKKQGLARFEVIGLEKDRELVRSVARRLAENDSEAAHLRVSIRDWIAPDTRQKGGIWKMLRNSPLVGIELDLSRKRVPARKVDL